MSRVRYSASASVSDSRSPASTLSLIRRRSASIRPALAKLLQDPLPGPPLLREEGEEDGEGYTDPLPVVQMDRPSVLLDDGVDDGKSEAGPLRLRGEERIEDVVHHVVRDPAAGVAHLENDADPLRRVGEVRADGEDAAAAHRLDGVGNEVPYHLPDLVRIRRDGGKVRGEVDHRGDAGLLELLPEHRQHLADLRVQVYDAERRDPLPGEVERLADDPLQSFDFLQDDPGVPLDRRRSSPRLRGGDPPGEPADRGERVLDLVGDFGRHLPERHEFLALHQLVLRGPDGLARALKRLVEGGV